MTEQEFLQWSEVYVAWLNEGNKEPRSDHDAFVAGCHVGAGVAAGGELLAKLKAVYRAVDRMLVPILAMPARTPGRMDLLIALDALDIVQGRSDGTVRLSVRSEP